MPVFTSSIEVTADYPTIKPSLNLNFARARALDPRISFTRASVGTYVGRDGLIKTAGNNEARFDHDPTTGESLGLLIEESRTNEVLNSSLFNESAGNPSFNQSAAVQQASEVGPDGKTGGVSLFYPNSIQTTHYYYLSYVVQTGDHSISAWFKNLTTTIYYPQLRIFNVGSGQAFANFDITGDGAVYSSGGDSFTSASIQKYPNGWYRCEMRCTNTNTHSMGIVASNSTSAELPNYAGSVDSNKGFLVWGVQVENNSFPTSYIPTSGSTATRAVDVAFIPQGPFAEIYNTEESTVLMDVRANMPVSVGNQRNMFHLGNDNSDGFGFFKEGGGLNKFFHIRSGGSTLTNFDSGVDFPYQTTVKFAAAFTSGDQAMYFDDVLRTSTTDTSGLNQSNITIWNIGASNSQGANPLTGTISKMVYYPKRVSNAQLLTLRDS